MAEVQNTTENYMSTGNASEIFQTIKTYILSHSGGGGTSEDPDGTYTINRASDGTINSIVFAYTGGQRTTTFVETSTSKIITELTVATGASTGTQRTITWTNNTVTVQTTTVPVS